MHRTFVRSRTLLQTEPHLGRSTVILIIKFRIIRHVRVIHTRIKRVTHKTTYAHSHAREDIYTYTHTHIRIQVRSTPARRVENARRVNKSNKQTIFFWS
jgi:hypothetical protein